MGKSTISMAIFNSYVTNYQRVMPSGVSQNIHNVCELFMPGKHSVCGMQSVKIGCKLTSDKRVDASKDELPTG